MNPKPIKRQICLILIILATSLINPLAAQKKQKAPATPTISAEEQFEEELHRNIFSIFKAHVSDENDTVIIIAGIPLGQSGSTNVIKVETVH